MMKEGHMRMCVPYLPALSSSYSVYIEGLRE